MITAKISTWKDEIARAFKEARQVGGRAFIDHLLAERDAGRFTVTPQNIRNATADYLRKREIKRNQELQRERTARHNRQEAVRRGQKIAELNLRIGRLPNPLIPELRKRLKDIPVEAKLLNYRKAVYELEKIIQEAEGA